MRARKSIVAVITLCAVLALTACGAQTSKGTYDDGYAAGYAAGQADAESAAAAKAQEEASKTPTGGIEYTITGASLGKAKYSYDGTGTVLILNVTAKNVSDEVQSVFFNGGIAAYQNGVALSNSLLVDGLDLTKSNSIKPGVSVEGWAAFELKDDATAVECEALYPTMYSLSNPQTIDLGTL